MADLTLALRRAVITHLKTDPNVSAHVGQRVHNEVPANPVFPFIVYNPPLSSAYEKTCATGIEGPVTLRVLAKGPTSDQANLIAAAVVASLTGVDQLELAGDLRADAFDWVRTQTIQDPAEKSNYMAIIDFDAVAVQPR